MKHFRLDEFNCKCGCESGRMDNMLLQMLDQARELAGIAFVITSGYRCEKHNKKVGGSVGSSHLVGKAVDVRCTSSRERYNIVAALMVVGFNRIGVAKRFIHVDMDKTKDKNVIWMY